MVDECVENIFDESDSTKFYFYFELIWHKEIWEIEKSCKFKAEEVLNPKKIKITYYKYIDPDGNINYLMDPYEISYDGEIIDLISAADSGVTYFGFWILHNGVRKPVEPVDIPGLDLCQ